MSLADWFRRHFNSAPAQPAWKRNFTKTPEQDRAARQKAWATRRAKALARKESK